jgi:hypothetical protein
MWAKDRPASQRRPADCEIRLHNPAFVLVRLGSNDVGRTDLFRSSLEETVGYCLERGILPVIGTKADRNDGPDNPNNAVLRQLAADYRLPLWDFDRLAQTLPAKPDCAGRRAPDLFSPPDYTRPGWRESGYAVHNLTALMMYEPEGAVRVKGNCFDDRQKPGHQKPGFLKKPGFLVTFLSTLSTPSTDRGPARACSSNPTATRRGSRALPAGQSERGCADRAPPL